MQHPFDMLTDGPFKIAVEDFDLFTPERVPQSFICTLAANWVRWRRFLATLLRLLDMPINRLKGNNRHCAQPQIPLTRSLQVADLDLMMAPQIVVIDRLCCINGL